MRLIPALLLVFLLAGCGLIGPPEDKYFRCMRDAGFAAYIEGQVTWVGDDVQELRILEPSPDANTPEFQTQSRECHERVGRERLIILADFESPENVYWRCMDAANLHAYIDGEVTWITDDVQELRILEPSHDATTPEFQAKSEECHDRAGGSEHLIIISD